MKIKKSMSNPMI